MSMNEMSFPRYVYQQTSAPTNPVTGALWVDTDASPISTKVYDGANWNELSTDVDFLADQQMEMALNILINSVAASSTLNDWEEIFVDEFTDANGTSNTIDTGNTTARFDSLAYNNQELTLEDDITAHTTTTAPTWQTGMKFTMGGTGKKLIKVTKGASCVATHAYLLNAAKGQITKVAYSGLHATFNDDLAASTSYYVVSDSEGGAHTTTWDSAGYPMAGTHLSWIAALENNADITNKAYEIDSITLLDATTGEDKLIQTNAITIPANPTGHQVFCHNSTTGTSSITYDISFDNGSTWVTAQPINQKNTGVHNGAQMKLKLNLNKGASDDIASADDYGVLLY